MACSRTWLDILQCGFFLPEEVVNVETKQIVYSLSSTETSKHKHLSVFSHSSWMLVKWPRCTSFDFGLIPVFVHRVKYVEFVVWFAILHNSSEYKSSLTHNTDRCMRKWTRNPSRCDSLPDRDLLRNTRTRLLWFFFARYWRNKIKIKCPHWLQLSFT